MDTMRYLNKKAEAEYKEKAKIEIAKIEVHLRKEWKDRNETKEESAKFEKVLQNVIDFLSNVDHRTSGIISDITLENINISGNGCIELEYITKKETAYFGEKSNSYLTIEFGLEEANYYMNKEISTPNINIKNDKMMCHFSKRIEHIHLTNF